MKVKVYSPELMVYQSQVTSLYSVFNRVTGVILSFVWLILFLIFKPLKFLIINYNFYYIIYYFLFTFNFFINIILIFILFSFLFHFFVGVRHFIWDTGRLLNLDEVGYTSLVIVLMICLSGLLILLEI